MLRVGGRTERLMRPDWRPRILILQFFLNRRPARISNKDWE